MHAKISFLLSFGFLFVSVLRDTDGGTLFTDPVLNNEFKTLLENHANESLNAEVDTTLTLAQLIIDSNIAPESVIQGMQSLTAKWRSVHPHLSFEDFAKLKKEYKRALGKFERYKDEDGILNYFTRGAYSALCAKFVNEQEQREAAHNDMVQAARKLANLIMGTN
ncbi:hypothetical protein ACLKA6_012670 [Drosophila palustris]